MARPPGTVASTKPKRPLTGTNLGSWAEAQEADRNYALGWARWWRGKSNCFMQTQLPELLRSAILYPAPEAHTPEEESPQAEDRGQWGKAARAHCLCWALAQICWDTGRFDKGNEEYTVGPLCSTPCEDRPKLQTLLQILVQGTRQGTVTKLFRVEQSCWHSGVEAKPSLPFLQQSSGFLYCICMLLFFLHPHFPVTKKLSMGSCCTNLCFFLPCFCHGSAQKWVLPLWPPRSFHT